MIAFLSFISKFENKKFRICRFSSTLIGIGKPKDAQHQRMLEIQARQHFYISGGNKEAYIAFLPFDSFPDGFFGYVKKSELVKAIANKTKNPAES